VPPSPWEYALTYLFFPLSPQERGGSCSSLRPRATFPSLAGSPKCTRAFFTPRPGLCVPSTPLPFSGGLSIVASTVCVHVIPAPNGSLARGESFSLSAQCCYDGRQEFLSLELGVVVHNFFYPIGIYLASPLGFVP